MAYLALDLMPMGLLRLLTQAVKLEWSDCEAWKEMKQIQAIDEPNEIQSIVEWSFKLSSLWVGGTKIKNIVLQTYCFRTCIYSN